MTPRAYLKISRSLGLTPAIWSGIIALQGLSTLFESIGIGMFLPVFQYMEAGGDIAKLVDGSRLWAHLIEVYNALDIPLGFATLLGLVFFAFLMRQVVLYVRQVYMVNRRERIGRNVRNVAFHHYLYADANYQDADTVGAMVNSLTTELRFAIDAMFGPPQMACYAIVVGILFVLLMIVSGPIIVLALVIMALSGVLLGGLFRKTVQSGARLMKDNQSLAEFLVQRLDSPRLIRLAGTEEAELAMERKLSGSQCDSTIRNLTLLARGDMLYEPMAIGILLAMVYVGYTVLGVTLGEFGVLLMVAVRLLPTVKEMLRQYQSTIGMLPHLAALDQRLRAMASAREPHGGERTLQRLEQGIRFEGVVFRYPTGSAPALKGIDAELPARQFIALVGPSGAGKSTLVDMLVRLRESASGRILFDNIPIEEFDRVSLRHGISYAPQRAQIFDMTAREHIGYGKPGASDVEIEKAARLAGAHDFIKTLPEGYDTYVGEDGVRLSGGQRHRLDLARALIREAPVLLLDEPTSNLDAEAEENFRDTLGQIRAATEKTIVVIAHRLSTVVRADRIIVLRDGQVEDWGTHKELIQRGGWYAQAYDKQTQGDRDPHAYTVPTVREETSRQ
ncbi:MAG: ABC transporter ATP-binding protein [Alphaproteobacteria bacterium]